MAVEDTARMHGMLVQNVYRQLRSGTQGIQGAKLGIKSLMTLVEVDGRMVYPWQHFRIVSAGGSVIGDATKNPPKSFREFIESPPFTGLGEKLSDIERLIADDAEALVMFRELVVAEKGGANNPNGSNQYKEVNSDNITIDLFVDPKPVKPQAERGTSRAYTLARLKKERPDLFEKVAAKEMSANAAAIAAGWRKQPTRLEKVMAEWPRLSADEQRQFLEWISNN